MSCSPPAALPPLPPLCQLLQPPERGASLPPQLPPVPAPTQQQGGRSKSKSCLRWRQAWQLATCAWKTVPHSSDFMSQKCSIPCSGRVSTSNNKQLIAVHPTHLFILQLPPQAGRLRLRLLRRCCQPIPLCPQLSGSCLRRISVGGQARLLWEMWAGRGQGWW